jgi:aromatic ring-opening dioxygenase LigB subunit
MLKLAAITPHPSLLMPGIEDSQKHLMKKTLQAMEKLAGEVKKLKPDTIVIVSPHGPMRYDKFTVNLEEKFSGRFSDFIDNSPEYKFLSDINLTRAILPLLRAQHFPLELIRESRIDRGSLIPLAYLTSQLEVKPRLIPLTFTALDWETHFRFGQFLGKIFSQTEKTIMMVASADLSHRLTEDSPAGYSSYGAKFDETLTSLLKKNDNEKIKYLNPEFCEEAGECGFRGILMTLGAISESHTKFEQLSYEAPFGIGHLVGKWKIR